MKDIRLLIPFQGTFLRLGIRSSKLGVCSRLNENVPFQGTFSRLGIRSSKLGVCSRLNENVRFVVAILMLFAVQLSVGYAQTPHRVDGKVTFVIEKKSMTLQAAQAALNNKTAIPLKVSVIFEGEWVTLFDAGFRPYANSSFFSYGIAQNGIGRDEYLSPLYRNDPPAWMYARSSLKCTANDGESLTSPFSDGMYIESPNWESQTCPIYAYGTEFSSSSNINNKSYIQEITFNGQRCYELNLFNIYFRLKNIQTVYVRGIDCNNANDGVPSTDNEDDLDNQTVGTTILNIIETGEGACYWPTAPNPQAADWTLAPSEYYGGIISGGIFIEQVPELTQFERSFMA